MVVFFSKILLYYFFKRHPLNLNLYFTIKPIGICYIFFQKKWQRYINTCFTNERFQLKRVLKFFDKTYKLELKMGSFHYGKLGRGSSASVPYLVMTLMVEPSKHSLCHDERYLNLWIRDLSGFFFLIINNWKWKLVYLTNLAVSLHLKSKLI